MEDGHHGAGEAEAVAAAKRLTRLDTLTDKVSAALLVVAEDRTPFLWRQFVGRRAWRVEFEDVSLRLASAVPGFADPYRRKFSVLIDADAGRLLNVSSRFEGEAPDVRPPPPGEAAEAQLRGQREFYLGLPAAEPAVNFLDALDIVLARGVGSPFLAKEIDGVCVMHARLGSAPRAAWAVTLRGLPPMPVEGPQGDAVPAWQRNHMRNVIDATTGEHLFATNSPQPR